MRLIFFIFVLVILGIAGTTFILNADSIIVADNISIKVEVIPGSPTPTPTPTPTPIPTPTPAPGGGGGGGGGAITPQPAVVEFRGFAYPAGIITVLKDGANVGLTIADDTGNFTFILSGLSPGTYNFGFWARDRIGRRSITFTFQITLSSGSTTKISGIVLPPTISLDKESVLPGGNITVSGASTPENQIRIVVASEHNEYFTTASINGDYSQVFSTTGLSRGIHSAKSKTKILTTGDESIFSQLLSFGVGVSVPKACYNEPDINGDGKINLIDFSIMAFWWKRSLPQDSAVDLNCDGFLSLADFSILAFNWTG